MRRVRLKWEEVILLPMGSIIECITPDLTALGYYQGCSKGDNHFLFDGIFSSNNGYLEDSYVGQWDEDEAEYYLWVKPTLVGHYCPISSIGKSSLYFLSDLALARYHYLLLDARALREENIEFNDEWQEHPPEVEYLGDDGHTDSLYESAEKIRSKYSVLLSGTNNKPRGA